MSEPEHVPTPISGIAIAALAAGAVSSLLGFGLLLSASAVDAGGSGPFVVLVTLLPIVVIISLVLSVSAGATGSRLFGVMGGLLTLLPLLVLVVGVAANT